MNELFDKQVNAQKEKDFQGSRKFLQAHEKVNETKKQERNDRRLKYFLMQGRSL